MELNKSDLIRLLSVLEGELQAREVVIAVLKAEQVKRLLYPVKRKSTPNLPVDGFSTANILLPNGSGTTTIVPNRFAKKCSLSGPSETDVGGGGGGVGQGEPSIGSQLQCPVSDPYTALYRDSCSAFDPTFDELTTKSVFNIQLRQLDLLIDKYQRSRNYLRQKLTEINDKYNATFEELQIERHNAAEYDRDRLLKTIDDLQHEKSKIEKQLEDIKTQFEIEREREKKMIICLLAERKQLIVRLIEEKQKNTELLQLYNTEKNRISEMVEGLEEESKRSLQMELDLERLSGEYEAQKEQLKDKLYASEAKNAALSAELERLKAETGCKTGANVVPIGLPDLGEGARSAIVTMNSTLSGHRVISSVPSVATVSPPKVSVARPVSPSKPATPSSSAHVSSSIPTTGPSLVRGSVKSGNVPIVNPSPTYATVHPAVKQPFTAFVETNSVVPPPTPPKSVAVSKPVAGISSSPVVVAPLSSQPVPAPQATPPTAAFTNPTYSIESAIPPLPSSSPPVLPPVAKATPAATGKAPIPVPTGVAVPAPSLQKKPPAVLPGSNAATALAATTNPVPRGAPPPVPPNKPVLPAQALKERSKELQAGVARAKLVNQSPIVVLGGGSTSSVVTKLMNVSQPVVVTGLSGSDTKTGEPLIGDGKPLMKDKSVDVQLLVNGSGKVDGEVKAMDSNVHQVPVNSSSTLAADDNETSVDILCQELADFQQLLVSMVASKEN